MTRVVPRRRLLIKFDEGRIDLNGTKSTLMLGAIKWVSSVSLLSNRVIHVCLDNSNTFSMLENVIVLHLNDFSTSSRANQPRQMNGHSLTTLWNFPSIFVEKWQGQHHPAVRLICFTKVKIQFICVLREKKFIWKNAGLRLTWNPLPPLIKRRGMVRSSIRPRGSILNEAVYVHLRVRFVDTH